MTEAQMRHTLACNLRYLRKSRKWPLSQNALSRILNISQRTIQNYEYEISAPSAYEVYRIAVYFGCTMEELLTKKLYEERKNEL